ncbi:16107_t:CDS:2 [Cetraspora pellucida]|uniref:16107_t:CDS:1 n=1 Tax=Cetraspora pellucida TaxID=1433469 RepID=A0ACA9MW20_9GLOM|nr:16107_t:CDS:2 [Cetraspora pellucida]
MEEECNTFSQNTPYQIHPTAITASKLINTKEIAELFQESEEQALEKELKKIEQLINQSLTNEQKELVSKFLQTYKKRERENKEITKKDIKNLKEKLRAEGLTDKDIEKIVDYCKRKEIKMEDEEFEEQQLIIEDYPELEKLYLNDNEELVIENCPQINKLDVHNNSLTSLEFIKDLESLEELKLDGNIELNKILEPYDDWKDYQKDLQESNQDTRELLRNIRILEKEKKDLSMKFDLSQQKYNDLKNFLKEVLVSLSQEAKKDLVEKLDREIKEKGNNISAPGMTEELKLNTKAVIESAKEIKSELENELTESKAKIEELEKKLKEFQEKDVYYQQLKKNIEQEKTKLEELKNDIIIKNQLEEYDLESILETQVSEDSTKLENARKTLKRLAQGINENEIDKLCQLQENIVKLEIELGETEKKQINQIIYNIGSVGNYIENYSPHSGSTTNLIGSQGTEVTELENLVLEDKIEENASSLIVSQTQPSLEYLIGKGGYGEVYRDIKREISILKNLRNRHIIQYYDIYSDNQEFLIIMDYAENGTLTKFINDNKDNDHDWKFNTDLIKQMTLGLAYIHQQGVIHRDLKSMNILLDKHFQVKISDFGLSKTKNISSSYSKYNAAEIVAKCTTPFKDIDNVLIYIAINNGKENIPDDTPSNIQNIIQQCDISDLQIINNDDNSSTVENLSELQNSEKTNEQHYISNSDSLLALCLESDYENFPKVHIEIPPK